MRKTLFAAAALALSAAPAAAQERVEIGVLDCLIDGGLDIAILTSEELACTFEPAGEQRPPETYVGSISKFGVDVGLTSESVMQWLVLAPTDVAYAPGALSGDYIGASAELTAGVGGGANLLVGGSNDTFVLQPLSLQAQTGLNVALGVAGLALRSTAN
ncbi:DUF992 domain-containing protein [Aquibium sp. A9E412]|uniref:DUF992 domain-containing protein n=1 Tax=Aquibium sp. A9E412 TaxID=2976767 RepID=UPI0025B27024|nr:DUF992 domain-containing protein [Aquibium sp. A9E412]MDN2565120.1 DUF992 domain-containing protein [Aquibium sp. A9E412]